MRSCSTFHQHGITLIPAWISNFIPRFTGYVIILIHVGLFQVSERSPWDEAFPAPPPKKIICQQHPFLSREWISFLAHLSFQRLLKMCILSESYPVMPFMLVECGLSMLDYPSIATPESYWPPTSQVYQTSPPTIYQTAPPPIYQTSHPKGELAVEAARGSDISSLGKSMEDNGRTNGHAEKNWMCFNFSRVSYFLRVMWW